MVSPGTDNKARALEISFNCGIINVTVKRNRSCYQLVDLKKQGSEKPKPRQLEAAVDKI